MSHELNFKTRKKSTLKITMNDENETTLLVKICDKATIERFVKMKDAIANKSESEQMNEMYSICATLLSINLNGLTFTAKEVEDLMDFDDLIYFVKGYTSFIKDITSQKN